MFAPWSFSYSSHSIIPSSFATRFDQSRPPATSAPYLHCLLPYPPPSLNPRGLRVVPGKSRTCPHCTPAYNTAGPVVDVDGSQCPPSNSAMLPLVSSTSWLTLRISYYTPRIVAQKFRFQLGLGLNPPLPSHRRFSESYLNPVNAPGHPTFPSCMLRPSRYS